MFLQMQDDLSDHTRQKHMQSYTHEKKPMSYSPFLTALFAVRVFLHIYWVYIKNTLDIYI